jgi:hypothetical protein
MTDFEKLKSKAGGEIPTDDIKNMTQNVEKSFNSVKTTIESSKGFGSLFG